MATLTPIRLTYEDYASIPYDGKRHEIIDGEHYVNPAPNTRHQLISSNLSFALSLHVRQHRLGTVLTAPCDVLLDEHTIVQPDIIFISNARSTIITEPNLKGTPDLLIEILSSNRKMDERLKFRKYEQSGVLEYWIVDPFAAAVRIFRREHDHFVAVPTTDPLTTPLLPGFALPLADVFA